MNPAASKQGAGTVTGWRLIGVSVRGASHVKANLPCQDALRWEASGGKLVAVLADGAGSASTSEVGADLAVRAALRHLRDAVGKGRLPRLEAGCRALLEGAIRAARESVFAEAQLRVVRPRELACTLTVLVVDKDLASAAQVGDGASLVTGADDALIALTKPANEEYLNETTFLTSDGAMESWQFSFRNGKFERAALFSDGLQMLALKLPEGTPHSPFFEPFFRLVETSADLDAATERMKAFLASSRITDRADDDLSLMVASLRPS